MIHQMNFVFDANTGQDLYAYAGQITPETADDARVLASQSAAVAEPAPPEDV